MDVLNTHAIQEEIVDYAEEDMVVGESIVREGSFQRYEGMIDQGEDFVIPEIEAKLIHQPVEKRCHDEHQDQRVSYGCLLGPGFHSLHLVVIRENKKICLL
jgi:hypothetical protein